MIMPSDKSYLQAKQVLLGQLHLSPLYKALAEWIDAHFQVKPIYLHCSKAPKALYPALEICLERTGERSVFEGANPFSQDTDKTVQILNQFKHLCLEHERHPEYLPECIQAGIPEEIVVQFSDFESVAKIETLNLIPQLSIDQLIQKWNDPALWLISRSFSGTTFFVYTDAQVKTYADSQVLSHWQNEYFQLLKAFDRFGYFTRENVLYDLDSKENFDNNYQSNWYYYYK